MKITYQQTGEYIKKYRKEANLTQRDLAYKIGRTESSIRKYEKGLVEIPMSVLEQIADTLGVKLINLIQSEEKINLSLDYYVEQLINMFGFKITGDPSEGSIILLAPDGEYEIAMNDIEDLRNSTCSFIKYKLQELKDKCRKIGK